MESLIREWDGESVIVQFDKSAQAWIFLAIHSTRLGPAIGGTRMKPYPNLEAALQDALRLAAKAFDKLTPNQSDTEPDSNTQPTDDDIEPTNEKWLDEFVDITVAMVDLLDEILGEKKDE